MADPPFGFGLPGAGRGSDGSGSGDSGGSGGSGGFGGFGGSGSGGSGGPGGTPGEGGPMGPFGDPQQFADALRQFADLMSWQGGPGDWDLAKNVARPTGAAEGDPSVLEKDRQKIVEAIRLADLWLDEVTTFPTGVRAAQAWSRSEWVEATLPVWSKLCDPIAEKAVNAMGGLLIEDPEELGGELPAAAVGALAREVVSSTDVGLPLGPEGTAALLPAGVADFGAGLSVPADEIRIFLALREAAHHRLFAHVPWLRARLMGAVEEYARGITVDAAALRDAMPQIDPANPDALREALAGATLFQPED